jgi:hypothetical protein
MHIPYRSDTTKTKLFDISVYSSTNEFKISADDGTGVIFEIKVNGQQNMKILKDVFKTDYLSMARSLRLTNN